VFSVKPSLRMMSGSATVLGLSGSILESGTIDCGVSVTNVTFNGTRGTNVTGSQYPVIRSLAQSTTIDVGGQFASISWFYNSEDSRFVMRSALSGNNFVEQNVAYSGGPIGTNSIAKGGAPNANLTEPLIYSVFYPANAYAGTFSGTYTITCSASPASPSGVNLTFKSRNVPYAPVSTLNPNTEYDALLTNILGAGSLPANTMATLSIVSGVNRNIVSQTITPGGCADPAYAGNNLCARFTYINGTTLIPPGIIYGKAVGLAAANQVTAVVPAVST